MVEPMPIESLLIQELLVPVLIGLEADLNPQNRFFEVFFLDCHCGLDPQSMNPTP